MSVWSRLGVAVQQVADLALLYIHTMYLAIHFFILHTVMASTAIIGVVVSEMLTVCNHPAHYLQ